MDRISRSFSEMRGGWAILLIAVVTFSSPYDARGQENGLRGEYFANGFAGNANDCIAPGDPENFVRIDPSLDFSWGPGGPRPDFCYNGFRARWTAWLTVPETGDYLFSLAGNDGAQMYLGGDLFIMAGGSSWGVNIVQLTAGERVPVRIDYMEGAAYASITMMWMPHGEPGLPFEGWVYGIDVGALYGDRYVSRGHRIGLLVPPRCSPHGTLGGPGSRSSSCWRETR